MIEPVHSFSQEHGVSILKGCTGEPKQPKVTHAHVQVTDVQGHTEQCDNRSQERVLEYDEQTEDRFQECVLGHNVDKRIPVSISNPNPHMHMQLPPPLLQKLPSDQTIATAQNAPASGQTFLVQSMAELLKARTQC